MQNINWQLYEEMGFNRKQVEEAIKFANNKMDIYDALQLLKNNKNNKQSGQKNIKKEPQSIKGKKLNSKININTIQKDSLLINFERINLPKYELIFSKKSSRSSIISKRIQIRDEKSPVGLLNMYNCCYLNSLLQCYFLSPSFMKYIFEAEPIKQLPAELQQKHNTVKLKRIKNQYNLLYTLKDIFGRMALTSKKYIDPTNVLKNLVNQGGQNVQFGDQKDLFEINTLIIQRLNQCLLYTKKYYNNQNSSITKQSFLQNDLMESNDFNLSPSKSTLINKSKLGQNDNIKRLFYGKKIQYFDEPIHKNEGIQQILSDFLGIIINPVHQNLYKALQQQFHYEVQIQIQQNQSKRLLKKKLKKHTYIREVPQYLYFYINRSGYDKQEKQALKNQQKISFEFIIYMDRFLQKYKDQQKLNRPITIKLWQKKNQLKKKRNKMQIFSKKLQECRQYAIQLDDWVNRLPKSQQLTKQIHILDQQLNNIENQLEKSQSRNQRYFLMFIFAHRGDAVSGHYWGYGKNKSNWYKFDINTKIMNQDQILHDLYKCGGTPYALVYVKQNNLPNFGYKYYKQFSQIKKIESLLDFKQQNTLFTQANDNNSYFKYIPEGIKKVIISENIQIHQDNQRRINIQIGQKTISQFLKRIQWLQVEYQQFCEINKSSQFSWYYNFSTYLMSIKQVDLAKFNLFELSLRAVTNQNINPKKLIENQNLFKIIRKQLKDKDKNIKLKILYLTLQSTEEKKYKQYYKSFIIERDLVITIVNTLNIIQLISTEQKRSKQQVQKKLCKLLQKTTLLMKMINISNSSKLKIYTNQCIQILLLKYILWGGKLKLKKQQKQMLIDENLQLQLRILGKSQQFQFMDEQINKTLLKKYQSKIKEDENIWKISPIEQRLDQNYLMNKKNQIKKFIKIEGKIWNALKFKKQICNYNKLTNQIQPYIEELI